MLKVKKKAVRTLANAVSPEHCRPLFKQLKIPTVVNMYIFICLVYVKRNFKNLTLSNQVHDHFTRTSHKIFIDRFRLSKTSKSFKVMSVRLFNKLPPKGQTAKQEIFSKTVFDWLVENPFYHVDEFLNMSLHDSILCFK